LPEANFNIVLLTYLVTIGIIVYFGIEVISQGAYLLMPFIFLGLTITMVLLNGYWDKHNLLPWLGNGIPKLLKTSILTTGSNMESFLLVIIAPAFKNMKTIKTAAIFGVGGATVVKTAFTMIFLLTFDVEPGLEKILPFYEMARLIYISRYVQRVEALLIILWVIAGLIAISISLYIGLYLLTQIFNLSALRLLVPAVCLVLLQLVLLPKSVDDIQKLDMILLRIGDVGIYVIPLLLIVATLLKGKRVKTCTGD
jgi:flagellar biosynthesis protein FlhB